MGAERQKIDINVIRRWPEISRIIKDIPAFGRTWGRKSSLKLHGSHITFISEEEIVIIVGSRRKTFRVLHYQRHLLGESDLLEKIRKILTKKGVVFE